MLQDSRHGVRILASDLGFSLIAMLSIAIGVGVNAAMLSVADGLVPGPLRVPGTDKIVTISALRPRAIESSSFVTYRQLSHPDYFDLRNRGQSCSGLLAYRVNVTSFAARRDEPPQTRRFFSRPQARHLKPKDSNRHAS